MSGRKSKNAQRPPINPILIGDLPRADEEALSTFVQLESNEYQNKSIGKWKAQDEGTSCDCHFDPENDEPYMACGDGSDCINRLTLVECIEGDCPSRSHCSNQRFQRKQYANIGVVLTEQKGYGLRASSNIPADAFIYEYIGEVVKEAEFMKRMRAYAQEGLQHFYFMMLQKEEYIDATKKGGIGRFVNHSCNPNCYVSKWFVGRRVRMGIFSKRPIAKDEELTFNYNVDRYGHDAQPCYCGEPNCVGFIGGKTQTDIGGMDDLYIDALGIADEVEQLSLRGTKKKKGKRLDEDFVPILSPIQSVQVASVCNAIRRASSSNQKMLPHLLARLKMTEDPEVLRGVMRLRGFSLMNTLLAEHSENMDIVLLILECMKAWPLINRNKIEDSNIEDPVRRCVSLDNTGLRDVAEYLLRKWSELETAYRIPRRAVKVEDDDGQPIRVVPVDERPYKRTRSEDDETDLSTQFKISITPLRPVPTPTLGQPSPAVAAPQRFAPTKAELDAIIAKAAATAAVAEAEATAAAAAAAAAASSEPSGSLKSSNGHRRKSTKSKTKSKPSDPSDRDKKLLKLVGDVVVKYMSRYRDEMDHEVFKKHAKELTHAIAEKEKKSPKYQDSGIETLSDEKRQKMKKFVHDYIKKVLKKLQAKRTNPAATLSSGPGQDTQSPEIEDVPMEEISDDPDQSETSEGLATVPGQFSAPEGTLFESDAP